MSSNSAPLTQCNSYHKLTLLPEWFSHAHLCRCLIMSTFTTHSTTNGINAWKTAFSDFTKSLWIIEVVYFIFDCITSHTLQKDWAGNIKCTFIITKSGTHEQAFDISNLWDEECYKVQWIASWSRYQLPYPPALPSYFTYSAGSSPVAFELWKTLNGFVSCFLAFLP